MSSLLPLGNGCAPAQSARMNIVTALAPVLPAMLALLALALPLAVLARWVRGDHPNRPPARTDGWSAGSLPSQPYAHMR